MTEILQTSPEIGGMGHSVKRKEDPRFIRGKGEYIDDLTLPGMLWLDIVRSPYAHATIKGIDAISVIALPSVRRFWPVLDEFEGTGMERTSITIIWPLRRRIA